MFKKLNIELLQDTTIPFLGRQSKELKAETQIDITTSMSKQPKGRSNLNVYQYVNGEIATAWNIIQQ